ncbi:MAG: SBBP repeat-containing protein, partial [Acidobacteriia bacterium]|nr:SBBP repeat-containing protein [Terriglobia bacterium]
GDLVLGVGGSEVRWRRPRVYQQAEGVRQEINAGYVLRAAHRVGLRLGEYDRRRPLIIDPVLSYATYLGGTGGDVAYGIAVDSNGNAYITGTTNSTSFPTLGAGQSGNRGNGDAFVTKLNATGTALVYSTFLGGGGADAAAAIAVDASGDAFVTGSTISTDFPTTAGVFQNVYGGNTDAFVAQLNSTGNQLVYSSFLGGGGADFGQGIAVDTSENAYVTGSTQSADFPTVVPLQPSSGGASDAFVAKVNFSGSALLYSTYLGGARADVGQGITVDSSGNAYVVGSTFSEDFPLLGALQDVNHGQADAFVAGLKPDGSALLFSTYLGGLGDDRGSGIALDTTGNLYVAGVTQSADFPTTSNAFQTSLQGQSNAFVSKLNSTGSGLTYSTFLGGSSIDQGNSIAVDSSGRAFVTGFTQSSDFPIANPLQAILGIGGGGACGSTACADAFVSQLNPTGTALVYSTYLGGSNADFGQAIALDPSGNPYITGATLSNNFPAIAGAYQGSLTGVAGMAFVAKIDPSSAPGMALVPAKVDFGNQTLSVRSALQTVTIINAGTSPLTITEITSSSSDFAETDNCIGTIATGGGTCAINVSFTPSALGAVTDQITITDNASGSPHTLTVKGTGVTAATAVTVAPTSLTFGSQAVGSVSPAQTVSITNTGTSTLTITQIATSGDYTQTNTCGEMLNVLNVGQSCAATVTFNPTASGVRNGSLSITDNAVGSPQTVALSGTGTAVFSLSSAAPTTTAVIGSATASLTVSASAPGSFTGSITLSCSSGATCAFSPASVFAGQSSTLTVSNLTASTPNPFNFTVNGISGSQAASVGLTVLFADYSLSATPALDTIVSGDAAEYTVILTPLNGFNKQVQLTCSNLPPGATCAFSNASVTPNGSQVTVSLKVNTVRQVASLWLRGIPAGRGSPPALPWAVCLGALVLLLSLQRGFGRRGLTRFGLWPASRLILLGLLLALAALVGACRNTSSPTAQTITGNYTISITGTLSSNTTVTRSTRVNLSVT